MCQRFLAAVKKKKEDKKLTKDQALKKLEMLKKDLFNIRFKKINNQVENPALYSEIKKNIARLNTTIRNHNDKKKTYNSHYLGCKNLANELLNKNIISFVQMGSSLEYGKNKSPHRENMKCKPESIYAKSKYLSSKYLLKLNKNYNFPSVILRLYQSYGKKQDNNRLIPITINNCLKNKISYFYLFNFFKTHFLKKKIIHTLCTDYLGNYFGGDRGGE